MSRAKYVRLQNDDIIIFSQGKNHSDFEYMNPKTAGFIQIYAEDDQPRCACFGKSDSLGLESDEKRDTKYANSQLFRSEW